MFDDITEFVKKKFFVSGIIVQEKTISFSDFKDENETHKIIRIFATMMVSEEMASLHSKHKQKLEYIITNFVSTIQVSFFQHHKVQQRILYFQCLYKYVCSILTMQMRILMSN